MQKLPEDADLWTDLSPLNFEIWPAEKMMKSRDGGLQEKTRYELTMAIFGGESGKGDGNAYNLDTCELQADTVSEAPSLAADTTLLKKKMATTQPNKKAIPPTKKVGLIRMSILQKIEEVVRKSIFKSSSLQGKYYCATNANIEVLTGLEV